VRTSRTNGESGFSLAEAIIATGLLAGALTSLADMFAISATRNRSARLGSYAIVLAQQKIEQLRALTSGVDESGVPIADAALTANQRGSDYVDETGTSLGAETTSRATYERRWSIEPLAASPNTSVIRVTVSSAVGGSRAGSRAFEEVRLVTYKMRQPR